MKQLPIGIQDFKAIRGLKGPAILYGAAFRKKTPAVISERLEL